MAVIIIDLVVVTIITDGMDECVIFVINDVPFSVVGIALFNVTDIIIAAVVGLTLINPFIMVDVVVSNIVDVLLIVIAVHSID